MDWRLQLPHLGELGYGTYGCHILQYLRSPDATATPGPYLMSHKHSSKPLRLQGIAAQMRGWRQSLDQGSPMSMGRKCEAPVADLEPDGCSVWHQRSHLTMCYYSLPPLGEPRFYRKNRHWPLPIFLCALRAMIHVGAETNPSSPRHSPNLSMSV